MNMSKKNHNCTPFYRVKASVRAPGCRPLVLEGLYLPKPGTKRANGDRLKQECRDYIESQIKWDGLGVPREAVTIEVTYTHLPNAFIVVEGKSQEPPQGTNDNENESI